eukprot:scaffold139217_cov25-Cyclotella_meneghiniana.AAC.1
MTGNLGFAVGFGAKTHLTLQITYTMASFNSSFKSAVALCRNRKGEDIYSSLDLSESELVSQLEAILKINPDVVHKRDEIGWTLLHHAAECRSPDFCKLLVDINPDLVKSVTHRGLNRGQLPFHHACSRGNVETA